jgi:hypothetical protein
MELTPLEHAIQSVLQADTKVRLVNQTQQGLPMASRFCSANGRGLHLRFFTALMLLFASTCAISQTQSKNLAPGFSHLPKGALVLQFQPDVELSEMSAGGVIEPKADWTELAQGHLRSALSKNADQLGLATREISDDDADEFGEIVTLHAAVAQSISLHHMIAGIFALPTKNGLLDWSLGDAVKPLREKTGADYALFVWIRDSYASAERKVAMIAMAMLGVSTRGGVQTGYASLIDLRTGQVVWFNHLVRASGDLRESGPAEESVRTLLTNFPSSK